MWAAQALIGLVYLGTVLLAIALIAHPMSPDDHTDDQGDDQS